MGAMSEQSFKVLWSHSAARDLLEIVSYIAEDSPATARKILARVKGKALTLSQFPNRGRVVPELASFGIHTYQELGIRP